MSNGTGLAVPIQSLESVESSSPYRTDNDIGPRFWPNDEEVYVAVPPCRYVSLTSLWSADSL
jgi:hypothetical protein